jgi:hypothetical protein
MKIVFEHSFYKKLYKDLNKKYTELRVKYENLKCCGNCAKIACFSEDSYCDKWKNDYLTKNKRRKLK